MPGQKKASGTAKAAATKKKTTAAAPAKAPAEATEQKAPKQTKTSSKQAAAAKPEDKKTAAPAAKSKNVADAAITNMMATAESNKPVAEPKEAAPAAPIQQQASATLKPATVEPDFQRDTFNEKALDELNGDAQNFAKTANGDDNQDTGNDESAALMNASKVSDLPWKQKKLIREQRFAHDADSTLDTHQIVAKIEADKLKRQERAEKFGLGDTAETQADKRKERIARFKAEQQGGAVDGATAEQEKEKMAARIARFGGNPESENSKKAPLQFTLDEYKPKKVGNFLKKRHHSVKGNNGGHPQGHFKKRFMKGPHQGPPQQGSHKFKGQHPNKRAKHF